MPTKERKLREKQRKAEVRALDEYYAREIGQARPHIGERLGRHSPLGEAMTLTGTPYNRVGARFDEETGQLLKQVLPGEEDGGQLELGANVERHERRRDRATELRVRYPTLWSKRGTAKQIAAAEGINVRTVQRYMKEFP